MPFKQVLIKLKAKKRGFHLITSEVISGLGNLHAQEIGLLHLFIQHTSASILLSENTDRDVLTDLENYFNKTVIENSPDYLHTLEGPDDLPAHIKSAILGTSVTIPIQDGQLALGDWQGIILGEHRNHAQGRKLLATISTN